MGRVFGLGAAAAGAMLLFCLMLAGPARAAGPERLVYALRMFGVKVGHAFLEARPGPDGQTVRLVLEARSNALVDLVFPVRDRIASLCRADFSGSLRYGKSFHEGGQERVFDLVFSPGLVQRFEAKGRSSMAAPQGCLDPLAAFYAMRAMDPLKAAPAALAVADGRTLAACRAEVLGWDRVDTPAGSFRTLRVDVDMPNVDGVFCLAQGERYHLWVTAAGRRLPVRIQARVRIGRFSGELRADLERVEPGPWALDARGAAAAD